MTKIFYLLGFTQSLRNASVYFILQDASPRTLHVTDHLGCRQRASQIRVKATQRRGDGDILPF